MKDNYYQLHPMKLQVNQVFYVKEQEDMGFMKQYKLLSKVQGNGVIEVLNLETNKEEVLQLDNYVYVEHLFN